MHLTIALFLSGLLTNTGNRAAAANCGWSRLLGTVWLDMRPIGR